MSGRPTDPFTTAVQVSSGDVHLHVATVDHLDGPVVVLLHGLGGWHGEWARTAAALAPHVRVVAFDQRGHGLSSTRPSDLSRAAHADDVVAVLDALGVPAATLVGQSAGGHTALVTAAAHPERVDRLVLVEAGVGGDSSSNQQATIDWFRSWPSPVSDVDELTSVLGTTTQVAEVWWDGLAHAPDGGRPRWDADVLAQVLAGIGEREHWDEWDAVACPTTLVRATRSAIPDAQITRMAGRPGVDLAEVDAGHDLHLEQPEAWHDVLLAALSLHA
ncbi:alpha/beta fold hydrolase [Luteipulveratus halotolerans]|uniref:alpha/beta fold hydrolase n=1 Tax=Luteipulveratus halotolerans TaxID=1631356 RepID=UPI000681018C|nr:alpha/beta hydrolase [Luteipulveratus halotolerans]